MNRRLTILGAVCATFLFSPSALGAVVIYPDGSGDFPTVQEAVNAAASGDTILLGDGIFAATDEDHFRLIDYLGKDLVIGSQSGDPATCVISGFDSAVGFYQEEPAAAVLENVTLQGNEHAIYILHSSPTIRNCVLKGNEQTTGSGRAIWIRSGWQSAPLIENCLFLDNPGGAIGWDSGCSATIRRCTFVGNRANRGAAIYARGETHSGPDPVIENCTFYGNFGRYDGVLYATYYAHVLVKNCLFAYNLEGPPVDHWTHSSIDLSCCNIFGHPLGNWVDPIDDQLGQNGNISVPPFFCDAEAGDFHLTPRSPCLPWNGPTECGTFIGAWSEASGPCDSRPRPLSLTDTPDDQGGFMDLVFATSALDTLGSLTGLYHMQRRDPSGWIMVESIDATGALVEQVTVPTRRDSIPGQPGGLSTFRIMADFWGEPSFSAPVSGYSRDDIAPEAPTELTANSALNGAHLTWSPSVSQDVHHYNLYYSYSAESTPYFPWATVQTDTTVTTGVRPGFTAYFRVAAVDTAGQIGPRSEVASCVMPPVVEFTQAVAGTEGNHLVTLTWSLETVDAVPEFALFRRLAPAEIWEPLVRDVVEKEDGVFEMIDTALPAGCEVAYRIDLKVGDGSWPLLETDTITMPSTPLSLTCLGNPFRETTRLMMYLPERASVGLEVFDVRGRRVADLHHAPLSGGWHPIVWTGQDDRGQRLSAGLYFAVLRSEKQQLIRKITLLR